MDLLHDIFVSFRNGLSEKVTDPRDHDMYGLDKRRWQAPAAGYPGVVKLNLRGPCSLLQRSFFPTEPFCPNMA